MVCLIFFSASRFATKQRDISTVVNTANPQSQLNFRQLLKICLITLNDDGKRQKGRRSYTPRKLKSASQQNACRREAFGTDKKENIADEENTQVKRKARRQDEKPRNEFFQQHNLISRSDDVVRQEGVEVFKAMPAVNNDQAKSTNMLNCQLRSIIVQSWYIRT